MKRFLQYMVVGVGTLALDVLMLAVAVRLLGVWYPLAVMGSFFVAISLNYSISRRWVFAGTARGWWEGYAYFALFALFLGGLTALLVAWLVESWQLPYLVAGPVGVVNYGLNLRFNFMLNEKE